MPASPSLFGASAGAWRQEALATLRLATPMAATNLLQMAVYAIDVIFVARLGQPALAASSLSVSLFGFFMWSLYAMTGAVASLVAAELGARAHAVREVRLAARMALWLAAGTGLVVTAVLGSAGQIMRLTGQDPEVTRLAASFMGVLKWAVVPMVAAGVLRNVISALGRPAFATVITALSIAVNAAGNYALVFGHWGAPALGLDGSAWSNVITALATLLAYGAVLFADRRLRRYHLLGCWWHPAWPRMRSLLAVGLPIAFTTMAETGLFGGAAFLMGRIGSTELAAHALALQIAAFAFMLPLGIGQAATIRVGYHFGAGDHAAMGRAGWMALATGLGFALASAGLMWGAPHLLLSAYIDVTDPAHAAMTHVAVRFLAVAAAFQLADSTQAVLAGALRGLQDTRRPMAFALIGYWAVGFVLAAGLGLGTQAGGMGVWTGLAAGLAVVAVLLLRRWHSREALGLTRLPAPDGAI